MRSQSRWVGIVFRTLILKSARKGPAGVWPFAVEIRKCLARLERGVGNNNQQADIPREDTRPYAKAGQLRAAARDKSARSAGAGEGGGNGLSRLYAFDNKFYRDHEKGQIEGLLPPSNPVLKGFCCASSTRR